MSKLHLVLLLLFILFGNRLPAQVTIAFMAALNGQTVNGLFTAQLQNNTTAAYNGKIKITVREGNNRIVLVVFTPSILVKPGITFIQALAPHCSIRFGNSGVAALASQTGRLPENEYEYCFEFTGTISKPGGAEQVFENCYQYTVQPFMPLSLVYPADGDELCNTRPAFTWQPAIPLVSNQRYRLVVTMVQDKQLAVDALLNNVPVVQQDNIAGCMLPYPQQVPELQEGKQYAWQVTAYEGQSKISESEIWLFTINCNNPKPDTLKESYREVSSSLNGNYYIAANILRFSVINPYGPVNINYSVTDISDPVRTISNLPAVKAVTGLNKIDLPLEYIHGLQANKTYRLKVNNIGDHPLYLQFLYKGEDVQ